jgi:RNA polymerase sigma-70 factor (ECF subfamily)
MSLAESDSPVPSQTPPPAGGESLLLSNYDRILAYINRHLPREYRAHCGPEDILQDAYTEAVRHMGSFQAQGPDSAFRWLATIARNKIIDFIDAQKSAKRGGGRVPLRAGPRGDTADRSYDRLLEQMAITPSTPSRDAARHEALAALRVAMAHLPDDMRQAVTLRYIEGRSVSEAAQSLGRTERAVHMLCYRALRRMRATMGRASAFLSSTG